MSTPQLPPQLVASQQNLPQRTVPTPLPVPNGSAQPHSGVQSNPNGGPNPPPNAIGASGAFPITPLSRDNFMKAYFQQWMPKHPVDRSMLQVEGRTIDLYQLHCAVLSQNGYRTGIQQMGANQPPQLAVVLAIPQDQWPIIAGGLGFVNFPGNDHEPARSGPAIAVHIERVYKQCLQDFDTQYLRQLFHHRRAIALGQKVNGGDMSAGPSGVAAPQGLSDIKDPKALSEIISYAALSVPELQARGVPNHIIALVEKHRDQLKSTLQQQRDFAKNIQNASQGQPRNVSNPGMANGNQMLPPQPSGMNVANHINGLTKPPMQPGQPQQPMNVPSTSTMPQNLQQPQRPGIPGMLPVGTGRPTPAQMAAAVELVKRLKDENKRKLCPFSTLVRID